MSDNPIYHKTSSALFEAGMLQSGKCARSAKIIETEMDGVACAVCGQPCCPVCSWNYGTGQYECHNCDGSSDTE